MIDLYHFTPLELADKILEEGMSPQSKYSSLESKFRQGVIYAWLRPEHDLMGYRDSTEYVCLKLLVPLEQCKVVNMDLISAAFVNYVGAGKEKNSELAKKLISRYESTAVSPHRYQLGHFRAPEAVIFGAVDPGNITVHSEQAPRPKNKNIEDYYSLWRERLLEKYCFDGEFADIITRLERDGKCQQVAVHDDSTGLLQTFYLKDLEDYFTLPASAQPGGIIY